MTGSISTLLNRPALDIPLPNLKGERVLVTGSSGFIGKTLCALTVLQHAKVFTCDKETDVLDKGNLRALFIKIAPTIVVHLAAHKYATTGEEHPAEVAELNIMGTEYVTNLCREWGAKLVLASTCKAADACTAYGASKLIAERIVLNYKLGKVVRLVNVLGSTGSVIDIWDRCIGPIPTTLGDRYWIAATEAADLLLAVIPLTRGVYAPHIDLIKRESVGIIATRYSPNRHRTLLGHRVGDRPKERLIAEYEYMVDTKVPSIMRIRGPWHRD